MKRTVLLSAFVLLAKLSSSTAYGQNPPPSVAQVGNSSVIAAVDANGSLQFYWQTIGTSTWNPEQVVPAGSVQ